jgi:hypothetical protein
MVKYGMNMIVTFLQETLSIAAVRACRRAYGTVQSQVMVTNALTTFANNPSPRVSIRGAPD